MSGSIIDNLLKKREELDEQSAIAKENEEEFKQVINRIFSSPDGQLFGKYLVKYCRVFETKTPAQHLLEEKGRKSVYLEFIRPYLMKSTRMEIE